ncbi:MAG: hypothetical protein LAN61_01865 [Acidobacteriia bacterium]|nr:hypothetical protein [Terriglobia bacterium]
MPCIADAALCAKDQSCTDDVIAFPEPIVRQQLQLLRDMGFLEFLGGGDYRLK